MSFPGGTRSTSGELGAGTGSVCLPPPNYLGRGRFLRKMVRDLVGSSDESGGSVSMPGRDFPIDFGRGRVLNRLRAREPRLGTLERIGNVGTKSPVLPAAFTMENHYGEEDSVDEAFEEKGSAGAQSAYRPPRDACVEGCSKSSDTSETKAFRDEDTGIGAFGPKILDMGTVGNEGKSRAPPSGPEDMNAIVGGTSRSSDKIAFGGSGKIAAGSASPSPPPQSGRLMGRESKSSEKIVFRNRIEGEPRPRQAPPPPRRVNMNSTILLPGMGMKGVDAVYDNLLKSHSKVESLDIEWDD